MKDQEAINSVAIELLSQQRQHNRHLFIVLVISILVNIAIAVAFLVYEAQWEYTDSVTTETTVTQEQCENGGSNVFQTGEYATYNASE